MAKPQKSHLALFYSYCHQDARYRQHMEKSLRQLEDFGLSQWSDGQISPGTKIDLEILEEMKKAQVLVYLVSPDFLHSPACRREWQIGKDLAQESPKVLLPIVLRPCAWKDFDTMGEHLALPTDGNPVSSFPDEDDAWQVIYTGMKAVLNSMTREPKIKTDFLRTVTKIDQISQRKRDLCLSDIFEFPIVRSWRRGEPTSARVGSVTALLRHKRVLLHGDVLSGKSALCIHAFEHLAGGQHPGLYVDLTKYGPKRPALKTYADIFADQATGSFDTWKSGEPVIILDNLSRSSNSLDHLRFCIDNFDQVLVATLSDVFYAYYIDNPLVSDFIVMNLDPLSHVKQERLVKRWLALGSRTDLTDAQVDRMEGEVNSVITDNRVLPRYPYFVLSIMQMREGFMPTNLTVTAYGHCHYMMILAHLLNSGMDRDDSEINACINFAAELAFFIYERDSGWEGQVRDEEFDAFVDEYRKKFLLADSTLARLRHQEYGIVKNNGFKASYMYYYFLGKYLADHERDPNIYKVIANMAEECYLTDNSFALISLVHHSVDTQVIDDLVIGNLCSLDHIEPATLRAEETEAIKELIADIPGNVISENSVEEEREIEREARDSAEQEADDVDERSENEDVNDIYRIFKCNDILAQIIRNR